MWTRWEGCVGNASWPISVNLTDDGSEGTEFFMAAHPRGSRSLRIPISDGGVPIAGSKFKALIAW